MFIFDLDGTLADLTHRLHFVKGGAKDWGTFLHADYIRKDAPIIGMISVCNALYNNDEHILILTGRNETTRHATQLWLSTHFVQYHKLLMRSEHDRRPDYEVKLELLQNYLQSAELDPEQRYVDSIFEDRTQVVQAWRKAGFHCCQVADGEY